MILLSSNLEAQCVVTSLDGGAAAGTLRGEVDDLNDGNCPGNIVTFQPGLTGTIILEAEVRITTDNVTLDGSAGPGIIIDGSGVDNPIVLNGADGVLVQNVTIEGARDNGIDINNSNSATVTGVSISGIGTSQDKSATWVGVTLRADGTPDESNQPDISISYAGINTLNSDGLLIENNIIFDNDGHGIRVNNSDIDLNADSYSSIIRSNLVGVLADGNTPAGNLGDGILVTRSTSVLVDGNTSSANGNRELWPLNPAETSFEALATSNFYGAGIEVGFSSGCIVINNFLGTNSTGTTTSGNALGNHKHGIYVRSANDNEIGTVGNGNISGGNGFAFSNVLTTDTYYAGTNVFGVGHGIQLHDANGAVTGNSVQANFVGYYNGNCIPNSQDGISILGFGSGTRNNTIGGSSTGEGNVIGGSKFGIFSQGPNADNNTYQGNFIGTDGSSLTDIGCPVGEDAIVFQGGSSGNTIGGTTPGTGNYIANTPGKSIVVRNNGSDDNNIVGNIMSCNGGGITLESDGNNEFGSDPRFAVNLATIDDDFIEGFSPNVGDRVDVYVADDCAAPPCQTNGGSQEASQGLTFVETILSVPNTEYAGVVNIVGDLVAPEDGYFSYDFSSTAAVSNGLTRDNVIFAGRDATNNTSEFHKCVTAVKCGDPTDVSVSSDNEFLCTGENTNITTQISLATDDPSDRNTDFTYVLYELATNGSRTQYATNTTGSFTIPDAGDYLVESYNTVNRNICSAFSEDTIMVRREDVVPPATVNAVGGPFCENDEAVQFTATGTSGSTFAWTRSDDASYSGAGNTVTLPQVTSNFTITVTETTAAPFSCTQNSVTIPVSVNSLPNTTNVTGDDRVCEGDVETYSVVQTNGSIYSWNVTATDATIVENGNEATVTWGAISGSVEVTETNSNGCTAEDASTLDVLISPLPGARNIFGPDSTCAGDEDVTYSVTANGLSTYEWTFDGVVQSVTNSQVMVDIPEKSSVQLSVIETDGRGCVSAFPSIKTIAINSRPTPSNLNVSPSTDICIGDEFSVSVDPQSGVEYLWTSAPSEIVGNPSTLNALMLTGSLSGTIFVNARNTTTGCTSNFGEQLDVDITIHDFPATPVINGPNSVTCSQDGVGYSVATPIATSSYVWFYGQDATGVPAEGDTVLNGFSSVVDFGPRIAEIQVSEIDQFGCPSPLGEVIPDMIGCTLTANFTSNTRSECAGEVITVTDQSTYADINLEPIQMWFLFPGADIDSIFVPQSSLPNATVNPTYVASGPGLYDVTLVVQQSGMEDIFTIEDYLEVKPLATIASENINGLNSVCQNFTETYTITDANGSDYSWKINPIGSLLTSGIGASNDFRFGPEEGPTTITVTEDRDGCVDSLKKVVTILPSPSTISIADQEICQDDPITITLNGADASSTFVWEPAANVTATTATTATFVFTTPGDAVVSVLETNTSGCVSVDSTSFANVTVRPELAAPAISGTGLNGICKDAVAQFSTAINSNFTYNWSTTPDGVIDDSTASTINISGADAGNKVVSLFVFDGICTSGTTDSSYIVEELPDAPLISIPSGTLCEETEVTLTVTGATPTSVYEWVLPEGTIPAAGQQLIDVNNTSLTVILGPNSGLVTVQEQTAIGCPSNKGEANLMIQKLLGDINIISEGKDSICTGGSIDSLAVYNINWPNATDITFTTSPTLLNVGLSGTGENKQLSFVIFEDLLENQVVSIVAVADAGGCDVDSENWNLFVKPTVDIDVEFDVREICEDESSLFTAILDSSELDAKIGVGQFYWFYDGILLDSGVTVNTPENTVNGSDLKLVYEPNINDCPDLSSSVLEFTSPLTAWKKPDVEGLVFTEKEYEITDYDDPLELNAEILIAPEAFQYQFDFYWKVNEDSITTVGISTPSSNDQEDATSVASMDDARVLQSDFRRYYVDVSVPTTDGTDRNICTTTDFMDVIVNLAVDPPNYLCHEPESTEECPIWEVENTDAFDNNLTIFNRWGSIVYESSNTLVQWDGTSKNGRPLPTGTYFYVLELTSKSGKEQKLSGPLSIIK